MILTHPPHALAGADPDRFDPVVAHALAELAALAYVPAGSALDFATAAGWRDCRALQVGAGQLAVAWSPEAIVIAVRGSDEDKDWLSNLRGIWRSRWDLLPADCRIGIGWLGQAKAMLPELLRLLVRARRECPDAPLYWSAHSAGGPIVTALVGAYHKRTAPKLVATFSSPRGWNPAGAAWYDSTFPQTWGIVPSSRGVIDPVTDLPWDRWPVNAKQVGRRIILVPSLPPEPPRALEQLEDWRAMQRSGRKATGALARWRVVSRLVAGVGAHPIFGTVGLLAEMAEAQRVAEAEAGQLATTGGARGISDLEPGGSDFGTTEAEAGR